jgi:predicted metalloprotease with PDZ domain
LLKTLIVTRRLFPLICCFFPLLLSAADYEYCLTWLAANTHTYVVETTVAPQTETYTDFSVPAWRPGRYYLQQYAAAVSHAKAYDAAKRPLTVQKIDQNTWRVTHPATVDKVSLTYRYYADNPDAGSSLYAEGEAYFNPVNLFPYVPGRMEGSVRLELPELPADWEVATALIPTDDPQVYTAGSYHEFVDCPTVLASSLKRLSFEDQGTTFYLDFHGPYAGDQATDEAIIDMVRRIVQEQGAIFGGYPFETFRFIYRLLPYNLRHAVEHSRSVSFALPAAVTQSPQRALSGLAGITAHEFWHAWNVKRIRPAALWPYDYSGPQYTHLHWFTEGVTDYYADLTLVRAGLIDEPQYLRALTGNIQSLENNYATTVVSPAMSSFDSWLASSPYTHPDHRISYYTLGSRLGMMLDLSLRAETKGKVSLDDVFRYLYQTYYEQDQGVPEDGILRAVETLSGQSWQAWFDRYVAGTEPVDYEAILDPVGLTLESTPQTPKDLRALGVVSVDEMSQGILLRGLHPGGDAYAGGLAVNDLLIELNGQNVLKADLAKVIGNLVPNRSVTVKVLRGLDLKTLTFPYAQAYQPRSFEVTQVARMNKSQQRQYQAWISTTTPKR